MVSVSKKEVKRGMYPFKIVYYLNWNLQKYKDRKGMVDELIEEGMLDGLSPSQLCEVANYLLYSEDVEAEVKLRKPTKEHISYEELVDKGAAESALQRQTFSIYRVPKPSIDRGANNDGKDADIPTMKELWEAIDNIKFYYDYVRQVIRGERERDFDIKVEPNYVAHNFYRTWYIDLCRNQYYLRDIFRPAMNNFSTFVLSRAEPHTFGMQIGKHVIVEHSPDRMIDLAKPEHVYQLLRRYALLKERHVGEVDNEWTVMYDLLDKVIASMNWDPVKWDILQQKIDLKSNVEIARYLLAKHDAVYNVNYISTIFRHYISRDIARAAEKLSYRMRKWDDEGAWKQCVRCKQRRLIGKDDFGNNKCVCLYCTGKKTNTGKKLLVRGVDVAPEVRKN